ncbi:PREDICTED: UDP-glycosyltransferase 92A1-like [Nicotiana attenuata]|uniref:Udp-glycosyltransferase 92a1 n=1 Tax=Nicotiana attenuata TaxID=49451 RepID=A0A314KUR7_NICAT|nr:PREDICTED: UDP-glycosyltransferase 92A1-like [Nicotiana attenuata]OIT32717.1 udp-glycosyltransferase 92a1 [Nicotiana attenuata]
MAQKRENIVMFPLMAQGHFIPFLALALKLEQEKGYSITFITTSLNIKKLRPSIPPHSFIRLLEIPYDSTSHGLPPDTESTENLPLPLFIRFLESTPSLKPAFTKIMSNLFLEENCSRPPLCVISDMFFSWTAKIAHTFGLFHVIFNAGGCFGMGAYHSTWINLPHVGKKLDDEYFLPGFKNCKLLVKELTEDIKAITGPVPFPKTMFQEWLETDGMLFNTVEEMDLMGLSYYKKQFHCPIWTIGPIVSSFRSKARAGKSSEADSILKICTNYLDSESPNSVLYVAFGSQCILTESQTENLARALESSGVNFIWINRNSSNINQENEWLPRIQYSKKGLIVQQWAPQMEILSHKSIGGILSHCGWNSVMEALTNGVPVLGWPMGAEQSFNAKMLEEDLKVCVRIISSDIKHEEIVKKIEILMKETQGKEMRKRALMVKEMIHSASITTKEGLKGSSVIAMDEFLNAAFCTRKNIFGSPEKL